MKNKQIISIIMIIIVTSITTYFTWKFFCKLFFFFGFFNPAIFIGTTPCLLLKKYIQEDKKHIVTYAWLIITIFLTVVTSIVMLNKF